MKHKLDFGSRGNDKGSEGFSLVELLLGLAIAAIIGASVYNLFWSATKLDDKMRRVHENYMEVLMADHSLTRDLENAVSLDLSRSYPDTKIFDGQKTELSFLTQTPEGIKRVRYFSGLVDWGNLTHAVIGRVINPSRGIGFIKTSLPIEFLLRQESSLADWENGSSGSLNIQIVAAGLKKGTFNCQYAPFVKDVHASGVSGIVYKDSWDDKNMPLAVSCRFSLYDPAKPQAGYNFKRDIFLAPVAGYHHE